MAEFEPVTTLDDLLSLDTEEVRAGYQSGLDGDPMPGDNHSRAFWHGWRNGRVDGGHDEPDPAQRLLVKAVTFRDPTGAMRLLPGISGQRTN